MAATPILALSIAPSWMCAVTMAACSIWAEPMAASPIFARVMAASSMCAVWMAASWIWAEPTEADCRDPVPTELTASLLQEIMPLGSCLAEIMLPAIVSAAVPRVIPVYFLVRQS